MASALPADHLAHLERVDPDRVLAARLVEDGARRAELLALYALDDELARVAASVREPLMGEMRLAWWAEALDGLHAGRGGRGQPVLEALADAAASGRLPRAPVERMVEARSADLLREPFADEAALLRHLDGVSGAVMEAAAGLLAPDLLASHALPDGAGSDLREAGRAWGWAALWRAREAWAARGRRWTPADWAADDEDTSRRKVAARVEAALRASRAPLRALPTAAFPAVAYAALSRAYVRGRSPGPLAKRATLLRATVTGRL